MNRNHPALAVLRRRTRLGLPATLFAMLFGGLALCPAVAPDAPAPIGVLSSPYAVGMMAMAAVGCVALAVRASRAGANLVSLEILVAREARHDLLASRRGEEFARRWATRPLVRNRVRELREQLGVSPAELAEVLGVRERTLHRIERGRCEPTFPLALLVSEYLGESVGEVFWVVEGPPPPPPIGLGVTEAERR